MNFFCFSATSFETYVKSSNVTQGGLMFFILIIGIPLSTKSFVLKAKPESILM